MKVIHVLSIGNSFSQDAHRYLHDFAKSEGVDLVIEGVITVNNVLEYARDYLGENKYYEGVVGCGSFKASYNLGVFYEVTGNTAKAKEYYQLSQRQGYKQAVERLKNL